MVQVMLEPELRKIVLCLLMLIRHDLFTIDPQQRSILLNGVGFKHDDVGIITMKEIIANHNTALEFNGQLKQLERAVYSSAKTTFIDVSDELDATPKQVVKMLEQADNLELVTVLKVARNTNCSTIVERKIKPADDRIKFMYVCKQDGTSKYGLVWDESKYEKFNLTKEQFEEMDLWKFGQRDSNRLASTLLHNMTEADLNLLFPDLDRITTSKPSPVAICEMLSRQLSTALTHVILPIFSVICVYLIIKTMIIFRAIYNFPTRTQPN